MEMAEYQCIRCGEIQESEKKCTCPTCGYPMYPTPFDRKKLLRREILSYTESLFDLKLRPENLSFIRKKGDEITTLQEDWLRFLDCAKIYENAVKAKRTEQYFERIVNAVNHLKKHIGTPYSQKYEVDFSKCCDLSKNRANEIAWVSNMIFGENKEVLPNTEFKFSDFSLEYREIPDSELLCTANELLKLVIKLNDKVKAFIDYNQLFGEVYKKVKTPRNPTAKKQSAKALLDKQCEKIQIILAKKYQVDILSDGLDEVSEMLSALWESIALVQGLPILRREYTFTNGEFTYDSADKLLEYCNAVFQKRYCKLSDALACENTLADCTEKKLFNIYNNLLKSDSTGYFGINAEILMPLGEYEEKLNDLIGLNSIKKEIKKIKAYILANNNSSKLNLHMCFTGNPGTGKTEVARLIAGIFHENNILPTDKVVETDRSGLVAEYVGQTAIKTMTRIQEAMGGVLFIDEAYALIPQGSRGDYGHEAVAALLKAMENYRGKLCVIFAGYRNLMQEMLKSNPGFSSRINFMLDFPDYSREELGKIAYLMLREREYTISENALQKILDILDVKRKSESFANARDLRNVLEQVILCQNLRTADPENRSAELTDVNQYIEDNGINLPTVGTEYRKKVLTGQEELEQLIGLKNVKRMVMKIRAYAKRNRQSGDFNLHMCFTGNPGTGKTEVARILSRILYEVEALPEAKFVETNASGLIGRYVGETAPKTIAKVRDALGGVLFIDEAYALTENSTDGGGYGDEAVAALLKEMEDKRGKVCVILAGYHDEMTRLLNTNPGFASRIAFTVDFPDYTADELREIAAAMLKKKGYHIAENALDRLTEIVEYYRNKENFANARTVRNVLEQVILNQNLRTEESGDEDNNEIILVDAENYLSDEGIDLSYMESSMRKIGF